MKTRNNPWLRGSLLATTLVLTLSPAAHALTYDWSGATSVNMSGTTANWGGTTPGAADTARWNAATYTNAPTVNADMTIGQLLFDAGNTSALTFGGTFTLTLNGVSAVGLQMNSGTGAVGIGTTTASTPKFKIGGNQSWTNNDNSQLSIWGTITNAGNTTPYTLTCDGTGNIDLISAISNGGTTGTLAMIKSGTGTLKFLGSNTFTGGLTVNQGTLLAQTSANALGGSGTGLVNLGDTTGTANAAIALGTSSTFNNPITVRAGSSGTATINNFAAYNPNLAGGITLNKGLILNNNDSSAPFTLLTVSGKITGGSGLTVTGSNIGSEVNLSNAANDYSGNTAVNSGTLRLSGSVVGGVSVAATGGIAGEGSISTGGSLTLADGSTLTANGGTPAALTVGGNLTFGPNTNVILEAAPSTPGIGTSIRLLDYTGTLTGAGTTFVLQNATNYRGYSFSTATPNQVNMTIDTKSIVWSGGTADWDVATTTNWDAGSEKFYQGDAVTFNDSGSNKAVALAVPVLPASVLFDNSTGNDYSLTGTGAIAGTAALTKSNTGILTLSTPNTYSGGTTISGAGKIIATVANALGTGAVTNNATLDLTAGAVTYSGLSTSMSGNGTVNLTLPTGTNTAALNGNYSGFTGTININAGASAGAGKAQMTGADNAAASINVLANGTLYVNASVTKNATVTLYGGDTGESQGQLRLETGAVWAGAVILAGDITGTGDFTVGSNSSGANITGNISEIGGSRALSKGGASTIQISGANSYTGATSVSAGVLKLGSAGALGGATVKTSGLTVAGGTLDLFGQTPTAVVPLALNSTANGNDVGSLYNSSATTATWAGTVSLGTPTVIVGAGNINLTAAITGNSRSINKNGTGTLALTNSGTVTLGTLQANRGTIQVGSGTTLNVTDIKVGSGNAVSSGLTLSGGNVTSLGAALFGTTTSNSGTTTATLQLDNGTLTVPSLGKGTGLVGTVVFNANFNGGTLKASTATTTFFAGANNAKVQAGGAFIDNGVNAITIAQALIHDTALDSPSVTADGGLTKSGVGTLTLSGANTYTGNTTVSTGTLALAATGSLKFVPPAIGASNKITGAGTATLNGSFALELAAAGSTSRTWTLVDATHSGSLVSVTSDLPVSFSGAAGVWTAVDGSKTWTYTETTGVLALSVAVPSGYSSWATGKGLDNSNNGVTQDPNNNGVLNLLEYVLNGDPLNSESPALILPVLNVSGSNFVFSFTRREESTTDTTQVFQYGTDLSGWTSLNITAPTASEVALGTPSGGLQTVTVTISKSLAGPGGKLFGRLQAVKIP